MLYSYVIWQIKWNVLVCDLANKMKWINIKKWSTETFQMLLSGVLKGDSLGSFLFNVLVSLKRFKRATARPKSLTLELVKHPCCTIWCYSLNVQWLCWWCWWYCPVGIYYLLRTCQIDQFSNSSKRSWPHNQYFQDRVHHNMTANCHPHLTLQVFSVSINLVHFKYRGMLF